MFKISFFRIHTGSTYSFKGNPNPFKKPEFFLNYLTTVSYYFTQIFKDLMSRNLNFLNTSRYKSLMSLYTNLFKRHFRKRAVTYNMRTNDVFIFSNTRSKCYLSSLVQMSINDLNCFKANKILLKH